MSLTILFFSRDKGNLRSSDSSTRAYPHMPRAKAVVLRDSGTDPIVQRRLTYVTFYGATGYADRYA